mgnify:CR=1 FL=1
MTTVDSVKHVAPPPGATVLQAQGVTMRFGGLTAVNNVDLTVREGEIVGLIGPNGAGKTTFFNCLTGLYKPTEGQVTFNGSILPPKPRAVVIAGMARTFQNIRLFKELSAFDNVRIGCHHLTRESIEAALRHGELSLVEETWITERSEPFDYALIVLRDPDGIQLEITWS